MSVVSLFKSSVIGKVDGDEPVSPDLGNDELLIAQRYCLLLNRQLKSDDDERTVATAWRHLEKRMSLVPGVDLSAEGTNSANGPIYIDRFCTSNEEYACFVAGGGYSRMELWPESIWPNVLQFVDQSGYPGPRSWSGGKPPKGRERHPVVGISWYEARAYALWVGKRLPTGKEWESASSWCCGADGRQSNRYPWGNSFDLNRTNTWSAGHGDTLPVDAYYEGATPNGVHQLIGNVWEWVSTRFQLAAHHEGFNVTFEEDMAEIRGGAFNTYFEEQATCQFRTGQPFLYRGDNVGFRCCISSRDLKEPPQPAAFA